MSSLKEQFEKCAGVVVGLPGFWDISPAKDDFSRADLDNIRKLQKERRSKEEEMKTKEAIEKDISVFTKGLPKPLRITKPFNF